MYNLFSFLPEQTFFIFRPAIKLTNLLHFLAFFGQIATQCIQEIHLALSVIFGLSKGMAPVGHSFTHRPQEVHFPLATGLNGTPPYSRYGMFPGNCGVLCVSLLCMILAANSKNCLRTVCFYISKHIHYDRRNASAVGRYSNQTQILFFKFHLHQFIRFFD